MNSINLKVYYQNITKKTGRKPEDFRKLAAKKGFFHQGCLKPDVKAKDVIAWLKEDFELGHGHSLAIFHFLKQGNEAQD